MRVLGFGAHPDDLEFQMGGTLAKYAAQGHEVFMAIATDGCIGSYRHTKKEIAEIRHKEAQNAADLIGAKLLWLGFEDEFLFDNRESRLKFIDAVRVAQPDVMFAHEPYKDYNQDHDISGYLAFTSRILSVVKLIETDNPPCKKVPPLFYYTTLGIINFTPEHYVDITDTWDTKKKMFLCHDSQQGDWCKDAFGVEYMEMMEAEAKLLAVQAGTPGCKYVEGFKLCKGWPTIVGAYKLLP